MDAAMSEMRSITPRPLRMPPLEYMRSAMARTSRHTCSESCRLNTSRSRRRGTCRKTAKKRYTAHVPRKSERSCEPRFSASL
jgi:hypothetical protein